MFQGPKNLYEPEDNCFLRIHIPYPSSKCRDSDQIELAKTDNVVLYE